MTLLRVTLVCSVLLNACTRNGTPQAEANDPRLAAMVDSIMPALERLSGLEQLRPLSMARQPRDEVRAYVERQLARELPPARLDAMSATYAALGLLPDTLDLRSLLLDLYTEQVVGYYDAESDRMFVVENVPRDALEPVLAHELVHALQDQHVNLDSLVARERGNDRQSAAQAAVEGHATLVMFAFLAEGAVGHDVDPLELPNPALQLAPALQAQNSQFPVFRRAPAIIRETLMFPYVSGAGFVHAVWQHRRAVTFIDLIPASTEQVLHVESRYLPEPDEPTDLALTDSDGWDVIYDNSMGELETRLWLREHLGISASAASAGWDGDRLRLLGNSAGDTTAVWWSVWDDESSAAAFAAVAARVRLPGLSVERTELQGRPYVRIRVIVSGGGEPPGAVPVVRR